MLNSSSLTPVQYFPESHQLDNAGNFLLFCNAVFNTAKGYGLLSYLNGTISRPNATSAPAVLAAGANPGQPVIPAPIPINLPNPTDTEWEVCNRHHAAVIYSNIKDPHANSLDVTNTAQRCGQLLTTNIFHRPTLQRPWLLSNFAHINSQTPTILMTFSIAWRNLGLKLMQ